MPIANQQVAGRVFLQQMYEDPYFPDHLVDQGRAILLRLCERIEAEQPPGLEAPYAPTQASTKEFNLLEVEFVAAGSEIETAAREWIGDGTVAPIAPGLGLLSSACCRGQGGHPRCPGPAVPAPDRPRSEVE